MKKRLFAAFVCAMMVMTLLPATAFAAKAQSVWIAGEELKEGQAYYHNGTGADNVAANYNAYFDASTGTLTLDGLAVDSTATASAAEPYVVEYYAIFAEDDLNIIVKGENGISVKSAMNSEKHITARALYVLGNLSVGVSDSAGNGSLTAAVNTMDTDNPAYTYGVVAQSIAIASGATLTGLVSGDTKGNGHLAKSFGMMTTPGASLSMAARLGVKFPEEQSEMGRRRASAYILLTA